MSPSPQETEELAVAQAAIDAEVSNRNIVVQMIASRGGQFFPGNPPPQSPQPNQNPGSDSPVEQKLRELRDAQYLMWSALNQLQGLIG